MSLNPVRPHVSYLQSHYGWAAVAAVILEHEIVFVLWHWSVWFLILINNNVSFAATGAHKV